MSRTAPSDRLTDVFPRQQSGVDFAHLTLLSSVVLLVLLAFTALRRRTFLGIAQGYLLLAAFGLVLFRILATDTILMYALAWVFALSGILAYRIASYQDEP